MVGGGLVIGTFIGSSVYTSVKLDQVVEHAVENGNRPPAEQKKFEYLPFTKSSLFEKALP